MIRYDFYVSGRVAMYTGSYYAWGFLLGHATEVTLKAALAHLGVTNPKLVNGHDIGKLFDAARQGGMFTATKVSPDLIAYVDDILWSRYPRQLEEARHDQAAQGRNFAFSLGTLSAFDDLLLQLDDELAEAVGRREISVGFRGACSVESTSGRLFFHANYPALDRLGVYTEWVRANLQGREGALQVLERGADELARHAPVGTWTSRPATTTPALDFKYPRAELIDGGVSLSFT